jgi:hypothetical protein
LAARVRTGTARDDRDPRSRSDRHSHPQERSADRARRVTSTIRAPFTTFQDDAGPSEVDEAARGHGLRRAVDLPYCLGLWLAAAFVAGMVVATRWIASVFVALTGADALQIAYAKAEQALGPRRPGGRSTRAP